MTWYQSLLIGITGGLLVKYGPNILAWLFKGSSDYWAKRSEKFRMEREEFISDLMEYEVYREFIFHKTFSREILSLLVTIIGLTILAYSSLIVQIFTELAGTTTGNTISDNAVDIGIIGLILFVSGLIIYISNNSKIEALDEAVRRMRITSSPPK